MYSGLLHKVYMGLGKLSWKKAELQGLSYKIIYLKKSGVNNFVESCVTGPFILIGHLLDSMVENFLMFGIFSALEPSLFEH